MELETFIDQFACCSRYLYQPSIVSLLILRRAMLTELWPWSWSCCSIEETLMYGLQSLLPCKFMWTFARLHVRTLTQERHKWTGTGCRGIILTIGLPSFGKNWRAFVLETYWKQRLKLVGAWVHTHGLCDLLIRAPVRLIPWPRLSILAVHDLQSTKDTRLCRRH